MKIEETKIEGVFIIEPKVFGDERGYFMESFHKELFAELTGKSVDFVQDNESKSGKNVLRGLHFQKPPHAQDKLVRVVSGSVLDVAVDLRKGSPTFGESTNCILSAENKKQLFVPQGMAHGFLTLEPNTIFVYKCSEYYHPESEDGILWSDPDLNIDWGTDNPLVSEKDRKAIRLRDYNSPF